MEISKIINTIREFAPEEDVAAWDNSGVNVAGYLQETNKLAVSLDPTVDFARKAMAWGAGCVLSHHPLYFAPVAPNIQNSYLDILQILLGNGAWLYCAHTTLDCSPQGTAFWLAQELELCRLHTLEPLTSSSELGFGQVGTLPAPLAWPDFSEKLAQVLGRSCWREIGCVPEKVSKVAYLPGSGASAMEAAAESGADVFITGDLKYHQALEAPLCILDVGHFVLEEEMMRRFALLLASTLSNVEVRFFESEDPFRFQFGSVPE